MPKYYVQVTGNLDDEYEIEAEDGYEAESLAEDRFINDHGSVMWSGVQAWDAEEIKDES